MNHILTDLQLKAQTAIFEDHRTYKHGIEVLEENSTIILKGSVPSKKVKRISSSMIRELPEVTKVENKFEIRNDYEILEKILR